MTVNSNLKASAMPVSKAEKQRLKPATTSRINGTGWILAQQKPEGYSSNGGAFFYCFSHNVNSCARLWK
jgi:hypothetical protein